MKVKVAQSFPTLCDHINSTIHGILQTRIPEWVAIPFSRGSFQPRDWTQVSCIACGFFTHWATREAPNINTNRLVIRSLGLTYIHYYIYIYIYIHTHTHTHTHTHIYTHTQSSFYIEFKKAPGKTHVVQSMYICIYFLIFNLYTYKLKF